MTTLPTGAQLVAAANVSAMQGLMSDQATAISEMPGGAVATTLTISSGQVTPTVACHLADTEGAAASDDLTNIVTTNHPDGRRLLISMVDAARIVTVKHNAGGAGQIALENSYDLVLKVGGWVELKRTGANWEEVGRSQNLISTVQLSGAVNESYATVASHATTADIWGAKGNIINFTGTATVTAFPAAPQAGVRRRLICAGACSFTNAAGFVVDGGSYTAAAGDVVDVEAVSTSSFKLHPIPVGGTLSNTGNLAGLADAATARTNLGLGTVATLAVDTDTTLAANSDSNVATQKAVKAYVAANAASATDISGLQNDVMQVYLLDSVNGSLAAGQYANGGFDAFNSDTIGANSTNQTYESAGKYYDNPGGYGPQAPPTGSTFGNMTGGSGLAAAFDGNTSQAHGACAFSNPYINATPGYVGKAFSSGANIGKVIAYSSNNAGWTGNYPGQPVTLTLYTKATAPSAYNDGTVLGTVTLNDSSAALTQTFTFTPTNNLYIWLAYTSSATVQAECAELQYYPSSTPTNMTLVSSVLSPAPASSVTQVKLMVLYKAIDASTLNTDFTAEATADGTNWVSGTLTDTGLTLVGFKVLTATIDTSAHAGTSVKYRLKTLNTKTQQVKGVALMVK